MIGERKDVAVGRVDQRTGGALFSGLNERFEQRHERPTVEPRIRRPPPTRPGPAFEVPGAADRERHR